MIQAISASLALRDLLSRPPVLATCLGAGHLSVGESVVSLTRRGGPRMPNGIECDVVCERGDEVWLGRGAVDVYSWWNPLPVPRVRLRAVPGGAPDVAALAGRGGGLTPSGDDLLCGYAAGLVLFGNRRAEASDIARKAAPRTTRLSATLLRHAAEGELPSPAHALLEEGDPEPLRRFGHSSGRALLVGLALAGSAC